MGPMWQTKPQGHWPFGSGEDFWRVFTIYRRGGHLGHVTHTPRTNFHFPIPPRLHMKFGFDSRSGFGGDLWKWWTDNRACLYYKLTNEPKGSGELKMCTFTEMVLCSNKELQHEFYGDPYFHGKFALESGWSILPQIWLGSIICHPYN